MAEDNKTALDIPAEKIGSALMYILVFSFVIPIVYFLTGISLDKMISNPSFMNNFAVVVIGLIFATLGIVFIVSAVYSLKKHGKGYPISSIPPVKLVTTGIYNFSRNPIYLGASFTFLGTALAARSFWCTIISWPIFTFFYFSYAHSIEEPVLIARFKKQYREYSNRTPFMFPFPLRGYIRKSFAGFLKKLSGSINRPLILNYGKHYFFLGYAIWWAIGSLLGLMSINLFLQRTGVLYSVRNWFLLILVIASVAGAHLAWVTGMTLVSSKKFLKLMWQVGFVSWGGFLAIILVCIYFSIESRTSIFIWFDSVFVSLLLLHFFGRIGCAFYGCCYGKKTESEIKLSYRHNALKAVREGIVRPADLYPIQLFSALYGILYFLLIFGLNVFSGLKIGLPTALAWIIYGSYRFIEEWYRTQKKLFWNILSCNQIISIFMVISAFVFLVFFFPGSDINQHRLFALMSFSSFLKGLNVSMLIVLSGFITFTLGYHRHEIGRWK